MSQRAVQARVLASALEELSIAMYYAFEQRDNHLPVPRGDVPAARRKVESALALYGAVVADDKAAVAEASIIHASVCEEHDHGRAELTEWIPSIRRRAARWEVIDEEENDGLQVS